MQKKHNTEILPTWGKHYTNIKLMALQLHYPLTLDYTNTTPKLYHT